jgi:hypothetical protein
MKVLQYNLLAILGMMVIIFGNGFIKAINKPNEKT